MVLKEMQKKNNWDVLSKNPPNPIHFYFPFSDGFELMWPKLVRIKKKPKNDVRILHNGWCAPFVHSFQGWWFYFEHEFASFSPPLSVSSLWLLYLPLLLWNTSFVPPGPLCANGALIKGKKKVEETRLHAGQKTSVSACVCVSFWHLLCFFCFMHSASFIILFSFMQTALCCNKVTKNLTWQVCWIIKKLPDNQSKTKHMQQDLKTKS